MTTMTLPMHALSQYAPSDYEQQQYVPAPYGYNSNGMLQRQQNGLVPVHMTTTQHPHDDYNMNAVATSSASSSTTITTTLSAYFKLNTREYEKSHEKTNNPCVLTLRVRDRYYYLPIKTHDSKSYKKRGQKALSLEMACDKITFDEKGQYSAVCATSTATARRSREDGERGGPYAHDRSAPYSPASSTSGESAATAQSPLPPNRYHLGSDGSSVSTDEVDMNAMMSDDSAPPPADEFHYFSERDAANAVHLSTASREELLQLLGKDARYAKDIQSYTQAFMVYIKTLGGSRNAKCWFALQQQNWYKIEIPVIDNDDISSSQVGLYYSVYKPIAELAKGIFKTKSTQFKEDDLDEKSSYTVLSGVGNGNLTRVCNDLNIKTLKDLAAYNSPLMPNRHQLIPQQKFIDLAVKALDFLKNRHTVLEHALKLELRDTTGRLHDSYTVGCDVPDETTPIPVDPTTPTPAVNPVESSQNEEPPELAYDVFYRLKDIGVMSFTRQDNHDNDLTTWTDSVFKDCWNTFRLFPYQQTTVTGVKNPDADYYIKRNDFLAHAAHIFGRYETHRRPIEARHIQTLWTLATLPMPVKDNLTFSTFFRMFCFLHTRLSPFDDLSTPMIGLGDLLEFLTYHLNFIKGWSEDHDLPLFCSRHEAERDLDQDPGMFYRLRFCEGRIDRFVNDAASTPREQRVPVYRQLVVSFRKCIPVDERNTNKNKITWLDREYVHHLIIDPASVTEINAISGPTANGLILRLLDIDGVTLQNNLNFLNRPEHIVKIARVRGLEKMKEDARRAETGGVIGRKEKKQQQGGYVQRRSPKSNAMPSPQPTMAAPPLTIVQTSEDLSRKRQRGVAAVLDVSLDVGTVYAAQPEPLIVPPRTPMVQHSFANASQWSMDSQPSSMVSTPSSHNSYDQMHDAFTTAQRQEQMNNFTAHSFASAYAASVRPPPQQSPHYMNGDAHTFGSQFPQNYAAHQQHQQQRQASPPSYPPFVNGHMMQPIDMSGLNIQDQ